MKFFSTCLLLLTPMAVWSQITLTNEDIPAIRDVFVFEVDNSSSLTPGQSGPNQIWDFRNFNRQLIEQLEVQSPDGIENNELFPGANLVFSSVAGSSFIFNQATEDAFFTLKIHSRFGRCEARW